MALTAKYFDTLLVSLTLIATGLLISVGRGAPKSLPLTEVEVTVVPVDAQHLSCASDATLDGTRCGYNLAHKRVAAPSQLQPFATTQGWLVLLADFFKEPTVHAWRLEARRTGNQARVRVHCKAKRLGRLTPVHVRFRPRAGFAAQPPTVAARVSDCTVHPHERP